jgi:pimeloyl-ACP methyl ester carboxylesterase
VERVDIDGTSICFDRRGSGPAIVLLHGLPGNRHLWRPQLDALADEFTVVAWDAPGNGDSADPSGTLDLTTVAQHLLGFVDELRLDRPHVVGLSWGGGLALELFRIAPAMPSSLVIASGYAGWAGSLPPDEVERRVASYVTAAAGDPVEALRRFAPGYFAPSAPLELLDEVVALFSDYHPDALAALARSFGQTDLRPVLPSVDVPTLLLYGDADVRAPLDVGRALHEAIAGSQLSVIEGVGHVHNLEAPERFNAAVREFVRSVEMS